MNGGEGKKMEVVSHRISLQIVEKDNSARDPGFQKAINRPR